MPYNFKQPVILVVEDNEICCFVLRKLLEGENLSCLVVDNGRDAINLMKKQRVDLVILNMEMPVMNGRDMLRVMRRANSLKHIFVIARSAHDQVDEIQAAMAAGADEYLVKPHRPEDLLEKVFSGLKETFSRANLA